MKHRSLAATDSFKEQDRKRTGRWPPLQKRCSAWPATRFSIRIRMPHSSPQHIRCASIEQLAIAVPAAIRETPKNSTTPAGFKCPEFTETAECLLGIDNSTFSCECNVAIQTALQLSNIVGWQQIHQSVRRAQADSSELGPKGIVNRLTEICSAYHPKKPASTPRLTDSQKAISLSIVPVSESHL